MPPFGTSAAMRAKGPLRTGRVWATAGGEGVHAGERAGDVTVGGVALGAAVQLFRDLFHGLVKGVLLDAAPVADGTVADGDVVATRGLDLVKLGRAVRLVVLVEADVLQPDAPGAAFTLKLTGDVGVDSDVAGGHGVSPCGPSTTGQGRPKRKSEKRVPSPATQTSFRCAAPVRRWGTG